MLPITEAQGGRNRRKGMGMFKEISKSIPSFGIKFKERKKLEITRILHVEA